MYVKNLPNSPKISDHTYSKTQEQPAINPSMPTHMANRITNANTYNISSTYWTLLQNNGNKNKESRNSNSKTGSRNDGVNKPYDEHHGEKAINPDYTNISTGDSGVDRIGDPITGREKNLSFEKCYHPKSVDFNNTNMLRSDTYNTKSNIHDSSDNNFDSERFRSMKTVDSMNKLLAYNPTHNVYEQVKKDISDTSYRINVLDNNEKYTLDDFDYRATSDKHMPKKKLETVTRIRKRGRPRKYPDGPPGGASRSKPNRANKEKPAKQSGNQSMKERQSKVPRKIFFRASLQILLVQKLMIARLTITARTEKNASKKQVRTTL